MFSSIFSSKSNFPSSVQIWINLEFETEIRAKKLIRIEYSKLETQSTSVLIFWFFNPNQYYPRRKVKLRLWGPMQGRIKVWYKIRNQGFRKPLFNRVSYYAYVGEIWRTSHFEQIRRGVEPLNSWNYTQRLGNSDII